MSLVPTCGSSGIGQFQVSRLCSCPHVQVYTFRQVPQHPIIYNAYIIFFIFQALGMCIVFNTCLLVFAGHLVILVYPLAVECDHGTYVS